MAARDVALLALGFGCLVGYARMVSLGFVGYLHQGVYESTDPWYALRSIVTLATFALLALSGLFQWFKIGTKTLIIATAAAMAAAILFAASADGAFGIPVAILGGASSAVLMFVWMMLLSCYDTKHIICASTIGLAISGCIVMGVPHLDATLGPLVALAVALIAGTCALRIDPDLASCAPDGRLDRSDAARVPWLTCTMILATGFLATVLYGIAEHLTLLYDWTPNYIALGVAVVATIVATFALMLGHRSWPHLVWAPLLVPLALALVLSCFSIREALQIAIGLMLATVFCAHFVHWPVFASMFSALHVPRAFLTGFVLFFANGSLAGMTGDALGAALPHSMQNLGGVAGIMVIVLVLLVALVYLAYRRLFGVVGFFGGRPLTVKEGLSAHTGMAYLKKADEAPGPESTDDATAPEESETTEDAVPAPEEETSEEEDDLASLMKARMDRYAAEASLTPRETEVALLTIQGFSCAYIAEKLVVSNSTVRFHQQNVYRKFDVHSRNELIELVTAPEQGN